MAPESETARARRYLLGEASEEECSAIEREYFHQEDAADRMAAAEDDLIEDYLSYRLNPAERDRFTRTYLAAPGHRRRVETIRQLMAAAAQPAVRRTTKDSAPITSWTTVRNLRFEWLVSAAALVLVAGALWVFVPSRGEQRGIVADNPPAPASTAPEPSSTRGSAGRPTSSTRASSRVFAVSVSPVTVRSAAETASVVIPEGTEALRLRLEGETDSRKLGGGRASVQTVTGDEVWRGPATIEGDLPPGVIARVDVPTASLPVDDYVVTLFGTDAAGVEQEWSRYFLRVRAR